MLTNGFNHVAVLTGDTSRFTEFYSSVFGATDGFVTDFGPILSLFFRDPDGLEAEVCVGNPDAEPGVFHPPGTPSSRYHPADALTSERLKDSPIRPS
ncbi:MAG: hypothetical protein WD691_11350 [Acidimicrobiales bacterium]